MKSKNLSNEDEQELNSKDENIEEKKLDDLILKKLADYEEKETDLNSKHFRSSYSKNILLRG